MLLKKKSKYTELLLMVPSDKWDRSENVDYTVNRTSPLFPGLTHSSLLKKTAPLALLS